MTSFLAMHHGGGLGMPEFTTTLLIDLVIATLIVFIIPPAARFLGRLRR